MARCWSSGPDRRGCRSPTSCGPADGASTCPSVRTTALPRRYRGRDFCWWLGVLGKWDGETPPQGAEHVTIAVSGAHGGRTVDFRGLEANGITLVGMTELVRRRRSALRARPRPRTSPRATPTTSRCSTRPTPMWLGWASTFPRNPRPTSSARCPARRHAAPGARPGRRRRAPRSSGPPASLSTTAGSRSTRSTPTGSPCHRRGVSSEPGVYFLGLPWLSRRGSIVHLGGLARREVSRRPDRDPAQLRGLRRR